MDYQIKHANGLDFAYYEMGTGDDFVFCFHGFPDTADTWLDLMPVLVDAGYRVIAPFMRGYPPTEIPADGHYSAKHLAEDVIGLIDAFDAGSVICIGHDWGALSIYAAAALAPGRISKMVTIAIPHPRTLRLNLKTLWKARHFLTFQRQKQSINWMKRNNFAAISEIFRRWSPNWQFTEADIAPVRKSLSQPGGVEGALGYYWSFRETHHDDDVQDLLRAKTAIPALSLFGDEDGALLLDTLAYMPKAFTNHYQQIALPDVGHFLHREAPDKFAELVLKFLSEA